MPLYLISLKLEVQKTDDINTFRLLFKGNVYFDQKPVCDDGWGDEEAQVVCRFV